MASITPNMSLTRWDSGADKFSHSQLAANMTKIDNHDHTPGNGRLLSGASLSNGAITAPKISDGAVTVDKLASNSVSTAKIQDGAVTTGKIADGAVGQGDLAAGAVTSQKLATSAKISSSSLTFDGIAPPVGSGAILAFVVNTTVTSRVVISGSVGVYADGVTSSQSAYYGFGYWVDNVFVPGQQLMPFRLAPAATVTLWASVAVNLSFEVTAGAKTVELRCSNSSLGGPTVTFDPHVTYFTHAT